MRPLRAVLVGVVTVTLGTTLGACAIHLPKPASAGEDVTGTWGAAVVEGEAYLELAEDGSASGSDGCNRMVGHWRRSDEGVVFSAWATTRMSCPAVDPWLSLAVSARLEDDHLVVVDQDAVQLGTLSRTDAS